MSIYKNIVPKGGALWKRTAVSAYNHLRVGFGLLPLLLSLGVPHRMHHH
jgi:hypothetical protein